MRSLLHSVAELDERAIVTRDSALHEDQATINVRTNDFDVLGGHALNAVVTGHPVKVSPVP